MTPCAIKMSLEILAEYFDLRCDRRDLIAKMSLAALSPMGGGGSLRVDGVELNGAFQWFKCLLLQTSSEFVSDPFVQDCWSAFCPKRHLRQLWEVIPASSFSLSFFSLFLSLSLSLSGKRLEWNTTPALCVTTGSTVQS